MQLSNYADGDDPSLNVNDVCLTDGPAAANPIIS
jgi:hypothetical protein